MSWRNSAAGEKAGLVPTCELDLVDRAHTDDGRVGNGLSPGAPAWPRRSGMLAVALQRGYRFLSDDFAARRLAEAKGITVSGTIGILLKSVAVGALSLPEADQLLAEMIAHGYRAPVRSLRELTTG